MRWSNGEKTQGLWQNNLLCGTAIFTEADGKRYEEKWKSGNREGARVALRRTDKEMKALLTNTDPPLWAPDGDHKVCYHCGTQFTVVNRRHHCRHW